MSCILCCETCISLGPVPQAFCKAWLHDIYMGDGKKGIFEDIPDLNLLWLQRICIVMFVDVPKLYILLSGRF